MNVANRLKTALEASGLNQSDLARELGIKPQSVQAWLTGKAKPSLPNLRKSAKILNVPLVYFLDGSEENNPIRKHTPTTASDLDLVDWSDITEYINQSPSSNLKATKCPTPLASECFAVTFSGDSMQSLSSGYPDGSVLYFKKDKNAKSGDRVLIEVHSDTPFIGFKILTLDAGRMWLKSLNTEYPPIDVTDNQTTIHGILYCSLRFER